MKYLQTHVFPLTIDFDLLDAGNVVHHPNYLVLCERARSKALDDVNYSHGQLLKEQTSFVLTETHSKYLKPALLGQKLSVLTKTLNFSRVSITFEQQLVSPNPNFKNISGYLEKLPEDFIEHSLFWIEMQLVCVKLQPIKAQAIPQLLIERLNLKKHD